MYFYFTTTPSGEREERREGLRQTLLAITAREGESASDKAVREDGHRARHGATIAQLLRTSRRSLGQRRRLPVHGPAAAHNDRRRAPPCFHCPSPSLQTPPPQQSSDGLPPNRVTDSLCSLWRGTASLAQASQAEPTTVLPLTLSQRLLLLLLRAPAVAGRLPQLLQRRARSRASLAPHSLTHTLFLLSRCFGSRCLSLSLALSVTRPSALPRTSTQHDPAQVAANTLVVSVRRRISRDCRLSDSDRDSACHCAPRCAR